MTSAIKYLLRGVLDGARFVRLDTQRSVLYVWCGGPHCDVVDVNSEHFGRPIDTMNVEHCCPEDVEVAVDGAIAEGEHEGVIDAARRIAKASTFLSRIERLGV
jgi:hypothetical protein